ncbi:hypothetical protein M407DRAFT_17603 [Tulasnella calospora MUT 4182]|uniref:Uncharacterized protein n=1 Tax=Tulasnella calospora MUT 4182 TaxID=1051891 RepID=A0A0C3QLJ6_9AGAM|nr:hypothetical protein M407DRAFT_17603 [Tulasnella calospora MUT 4182]
MSSAAEIRLKSVGRPCFVLPATSLRMADDHSLTLATTGSPQSCSASLEVSSDPWSQVEVYRGAIELPAYKAKFTNGSLFAGPSDAEAEKLGILRLNAIWRIREALKSTGSTSTQSSCTCAICQSSSSAHLNRVQNLINNEETLKFPPILLG